MFIVVSAVLVSPAVLFLFLLVSRPILAVFCFDQPHADATAALDADSHFECRTLFDPSGRVIFKGGMAARSELSRSEFISGCYTEEYMPVRRWSCPEKVCVSAARRQKLYAAIRRHFSRDFWTTDKQFNSSCFFQFIEAQNASVADAKQLTITHGEHPRVASLRCQDFAYFDGYMLCVCRSDRCNDETIVSAFYLMREWVNSMPYDSLVANGSSTTAISSTFAFPFATIFVSFSVGAAFLAMFGFFIVLPLDRKYLTKRNRRRKRDLAEKRAREEDARIADQLALAEDRLVGDPIDYQAFFGENFYINPDKEINKFEGTSFAPVPRAFGPFKEVRTTPKMPKKKVMRKVVKLEKREKAMMEARWREKQARLVGRGKRAKKKKARGFHNLVKLLKRSISVSKEAYNKSDHVRTESLPPPTSGPGTANQTSPTLANPTITTSTSAYGPTPPPPVPQKRRRRASTRSTLKTERTPSKTTLTIAPKSTRSTALSIFTNAKSPRSMLTTPTVTLGAGKAPPHPSPSLDTDRTAETPMADHPSTIHEMTK